MSFLEFAPVPTLDSSEKASRQEIPAFLALRGTVGRTRFADPADLAATKRSLFRTGHLRRPEYAKHSNRTSNELLDAIESFQRMSGLRVDGYLEPGGNTARALGERLAGKTPGVDLVGDDERPTEEQRDHLYWNIDIPTCRGIMARRGRRAAASCFHTATFRYGECLAGRPINQLPPLDTWNQ